MKEVCPKDRCTHNRDNSYAKGASCRSQKHLPGKRAIVNCCETRNLWEKDESQQSVQLLNRTSDLADDPVRAGRVRSSERTENDYV